MIIGHHRIIPRTEKETLDLLKSELRQAIINCDTIASHPRSGVEFVKLTNSMIAVENCAREMAKYRVDHRWLNGIFHFAEVMRRAQHWLTPATVESKKLFTLLADNLRKLQIWYSRIELLRPLSLGPILPDIQAAPLRQGRPVQVLKHTAARAPRLILPQGFSRG